MSSRIKIVTRKRGITVRNGVPKLGAKEDQKGKKEKERRKSSLPGVCLSTRFDPREKHSFREDNNNVNLGSNFKCPEPVYARGNGTV